MEPSAESYAVLYPEPARAKDSSRLTRASAPARRSRTRRRARAFTATQNATGQPAINLPLHWNKEGLPIGVQFVGRFGDELGLLKLAAQLEKAAPWKDRRPPAM